MWAVLLATLAMIAGLVIIVGAIAGVYAVGVVVRVRREIGL